MLTFPLSKSFDLCIVNITKNTKLLTLGSTSRIFIINIDNSHRCYRVHLTTLTSSPRPWWELSTIYANPTFPALFDELQFCNQVIFMIIVVDVLSAEYKVNGFTQNTNFGLWNSICNAGSRGFHIMKRA